MTVIATSIAPNSTATSYSNQRKVDRTQNGVLWAMFWDGTSTTTASMEFWYSTDDGATWNEGDHFGFAGTGTTHAPNASFFIDLDDFAHVVYKDRHNGQIYYRRGTPNAARTAWTWSAATAIYPSADGDYPDIVAHREGTGWKAHVVLSTSGGGQNGGYYREITITSGGSVSFTGSLLVGNAGNANHIWPSIDFHHTGDGKTVKDGTPHLYAAWTAGEAGPGKGTRFRKATYSAGSWTWGGEREIDWRRYVLNLNFWLNCMFDGTRVVIAGLLVNGGALNDVVLYERDEEDTTTVTRVLIETTNDETVLFTGGSTYDAGGNVYFFGDNDVNKFGALNDIVYHKWTRAGEVFGDRVVVGQAANPYFSVKRGGSEKRVEYIFTANTSSPYNVTFGYIEANQPPNAPIINHPIGIEIDPSKVHRFEWSFIDPDDVDVQGRYRIQIRNLSV